MCSERGMESNCNGGERVFEECNGCETSSSDLSGRSGGCAGVGAIKQGSELKLVQSACASVYEERGMVICDKACHEMSLARMMCTITVY